jgi:hypothetical protein
MWCGVHVVFTYVYTCLHMFTYVYICLRMFTCVYICLHMFTYVYVCCLHMLLVADSSSMEPAALLACINPPLLPLLYAFEREIRGDMLDCLMRRN